MTSHTQGYSSRQASSPSAARSSRNRARLKSRYDSTPTCSRRRTTSFVGEVGGVGQNSKGQIFVYTRTGHPYATLGDNRTFSRGTARSCSSSTPTGKFVRELGQDVYGFNAAYGLRVDPQDNVWTVDAAANQVVKFDSEGRVALVLGRKPEAISVRPAAPARAVDLARGGGWHRWRARSGPRWRVPAAAPGSGTPGSTFNRPSDVAWDKAGNIYIADGIGGNVNRIAKFNKDGNFLKQWGSTGDGQRPVQRPEGARGRCAGQRLRRGLRATSAFRCSTATATSSRSSRHRHPLTMCMTTGATQYLYISHSGDKDGMEDAAIYKVTLDGKVVGKFGAAGQAARSSSVSRTRSTAATRTNCSSAR